MDIDVIYRGFKFDICSVMNNFVGFMESLEPKDFRKTMALLHYSADHGVPINETKFRKLKGQGICEFKSDQVRLFCFFDKSRLIIIAHGFIKKSTRTPVNEIAKAIRLKKQYFKR